MGGSVPTAVDICNKAIEIALAGSAAFKVIEFFTTNPDEELSTDKLEAKFGKPAAQFYSILAAALQAGVLKRHTNEEDELVYSLGNGSAGVQSNPGRHPNLRPDALLAGAELGKKIKTKTSRKYIDIDITKIEIRKDVPLPERGNVGGLIKKLTELLGGLQINDSCEIPAEAKSTLLKACSNVSAATSAKFAVRTINETTVGVWRTA